MLPSSSAAATSHAGKAASATPVTPFNQCVPVGADASCGDLVDVTDLGTAIYADPSQGPYDGSDDTLVGVQNDSSEPVVAVVLSSDTDIFGFDGDGICSGFTPGPPACPYGPTGYEGPDTSFGSVNGDATAGVVLFPTPLAPGTWTYFSLEEALSATDVTGGGPSASEQGGACNAAEHGVTQSCAQPVNIATGEFWHTFTDFSIGGRGVPLDLARTYTSANAATDGPFGFGWTDSYSMSLTTDASGVVTVHQEDGSTVAFSPNGSGGYSAPPRVLASLIASAEGNVRVHPRFRPRHVRFLGRRPTAERSRPERCDDGSRLQRQRAGRRRPIRPGGR